MHEWLITHPTQEGARIIGYVWATDEAAAIAVAVEKFGLASEAKTLEAHLVTSP